MLKIRRPLSPHLQIYRPQLTSVLSVLHRATGMVLSAGSIALMGWLLAVASGEDWFLVCQSFFESAFGLIFLIGISFCFFYHLFNGMRHLTWDTGHAFDLPSVYKVGYLVIGLSALSTGSLWLFVFTNLI